MLSVSGTGIATLSTLTCAVAAELSMTSTAALAVSNIASPAADLTLTSNGAALTVSAGTAMRGVIQALTGSPILDLTTQVAAGQTLTLNAAVGNVQGAITGAATSSVLKVQAGAVTSATTLSFTTGTLEATSVVTLPGAALTTLSLTGVVVQSGVTVSGPGLLELNAGTTVQGPSSTLTPTTIRTFPSVRLLVFVMD